MKRLPRFLALFCAIAIAFTLSHLSFARPGGGQSFRGGSSSSRSSSSGGSVSRSTSSSSGTVYYGGGGGGGSASIGEIFGSIIVLIIIVLISAAISAAKRKAQASWSTAMPNYAAYVQPFGAGYQQPGKRPENPRRALEQLKAFDERFSLVVFDDFLSALYTEIVRARGQRVTERFSAYLDPSAAATMAQRPLDGVTSVLVGSATIENVSGLEGNEVSVEVAFETNLSRRDPKSGAEQAIYVKESWTLGRAKTAKSRTPDKARVFACPNCTAPLEQIFGGQCKHCGQAVASGAFDWVVRRIAVLETEVRPPMLTGTTEEQGTDFPTVVQPDAAAKFGSLQSKGLEWNNFSARVALIFAQFQKGWSDRDLQNMRPFLSDALFAQQSYWVSEYLRQRLRNVTENPRILRLELANVTSDAFYDSVTVRLYAASLDFTVADVNNQIVAGSRQKERTYSEYWTLIRGRAATAPAKTDLSCPRCGAPLAINMGGQCNYCQAKVTSGEFDWVLSRIEQDEVYRG